MPTFKPNAAPGFLTSARRNQSPNTGCGIAFNTSHLTASHFVMKSLTVTRIITGQNSAALLLLRIFLALLAVDAETGMGECVESFERDLLNTVVNLAEGILGTIQPLARHVILQQEPALLSCGE